MFRILGSNFARALAVTAAVVVLPFSLGGCSSSNSNNDDAGSGADTGPSVCDLAGAESVLMASCTSSTCHNATDKQAGLNLTTGADLGTRLVGVMPSAATSVSCGSNTTPYLTAASNPAAGLLIQKISSSSPPCGLRMPYGLPALTAAQIGCITTGLTHLTSPP